jgi:hypothetical protein
MNSILRRAAQAGRNQMLVAGFASVRRDRVAWPDRHWEWPALRCDDGDFERRTGTDVEARDRWFAHAIGASPMMFQRSPGTSALYWLAVRDSGGAYLDGGKSYRLTIPLRVPARYCWSVTVYDAESRSQVVTEQMRATLRSTIELKHLSRMSTVDLYFGPDIPLTGDTRGIRTLRERGWFAYLRIYGPERAAFDGSWRPADIAEIP